MVRHVAASWCFASFVAAEIFFIGAAAMWPQMPTERRGQVVVAALEPPPPPAVPEEKPALGPPKKSQTGVASWYGDDWQGRITASGKPFDAHKSTAAHRTLPLNTRARVTNLKTGRSVEVTIIDRGPYADGRVIDLSKAAAMKLGMVKEGLAPVRIQSLPG